MYNDYNYRHDTTLAESLGIHYTGKRRAYRKSLRDMGVFARAFTQIVLEDVFDRGFVGPTVGALTNVPIPQRIQRLQGIEYSDAINAMTPILVQQAQATTRFKNLMDWVSPYVSAFERATDKQIVAEFKLEARVQAEDGKQVLAAYPLLDLVHDNKRFATAWDCHKGTAWGLNSYKQS
jgi:hypothetical protein